MTDVACAISYLLGLLTACAVAIVWLRRTDRRDE